MMNNAQEQDKKLKETYKQIIKLAKLSSQEMFAGIDLDLNPLDDDDPNAKKMQLDISDLGKKLYGILESGGDPKKVLQLVSEIQDCANEQIRLGKDAMMQETDPRYFLFIYFDFFFLLFIYYFKKIAKREFSVKLLVRVFFTKLFFSFFIYLLYIIIFFYSQLGKSNARIN